MPPIINIVIADLKFLQEEWDNTVDDHSLRRSSPVLRRLLVHNDLQKAWLAAGFKKEPKISASTLNPILQTMDKRKIIFAAAGGAKYQNMELRGLLMTKEIADQTEVQRQYQQGVPEEILGLREFINATSIVIAGQEISRKTVIKFIANKLGGDHFDPKRGSSPEEKLFALLDEASEQEKIKLAGKNAVYFELLSAGQALINSPDIQKLLQHQK